MAKVEVRNIKDYTLDPGIDDGIGQALWQRSMADHQPVDASVYVVKAGRSWPPDLYHPRCSELVLWWGGSGKVILRLPEMKVPWPKWELSPDWDSTVHAVDLKPGASVVVPRGALRRFTADAGGDLVLVVVHAEDPLENPGSIGATSPTPSISPAFTRNLDASPYSDEQPRRRRRAKRNRVWGQEVKSPGGPLPDPSKAEFHVVQYVFKPSQWNPYHFHPRSVELVICRKGEGEANVTFPQTPGKFPGWDKASTETVPLNPGDTMIVPKAALHEYWDKTESSDLFLLAMQTPQPIMHITEAEL